MSSSEKTQEKINLSLKMSNNENENEELELSLGLSLNGQFGVDKRLKRSSSISDFPFSSKNGNVSQARGVAFDSHAPLVRTCSLPVVQSEEEFWKRKEEQAARRLEARMKRLEKKNGKVINYKDNSCFDEGSNSNNENGESLVKSKSNESAGVVVNGGGTNVLGSQGSIGSQRSGSSGLSDLHSQQQVEGTAQKAEVKSPSSVRSVQVQVKQEPHVNVNGKRTNEVVKSTLIDMPFVSTTTDGKRIEGFLYKYKKGEEVKIVCVCHGLFLSPAEFIKHGGGGDVEHPLKHIVVSTAPMF